MSPCASTMLQFGSLTSLRVPASISVKASARLACTPLMPFNRKRVLKASILSRRLAISANANYGSEWATPQDAYVTVGLAHCYEKGNDGKIADLFVIEPISANSLECMANGGRTSFTHVFSLTLGDAMAKNKSMLPPEFNTGIFCDGFEDRADSCARTWMRPHAIDNLLDIVPLGQIKSGFNYDTTDKRVLNMDNVVNDDDNIKQDMSIDVYGRKGEDGIDVSAESIINTSSPPAAAEADDDDDDVDSLLAA